MRFSQSGSGSLRGSARSETVFGVHQSISRSRQFLGPVEKDDLATPQGDAIYCSTTDGCSGRLTTFQGDDRHGGLVD